MPTNEPPWRLGHADDTPLRPASDRHESEYRAEKLLDQLAGIIRDAYIAENLGDLRAFVRGNLVAEEFLDKLDGDDLYSMVCLLVRDYASDQAAIATTVPDHVPADLSGEVA